MKKHIPSTAILLFSTFGTLAQGVVNFSTRLPGTVIGHVYDQELGNRFLSKTGNTSAETPPGTQTYSGALLTGSGFSAQLWYAPGAGQPEGALVLLPGSTTTFRTGATLGGTPAPLTLTVPGVVPVTGVGTFQVRAWDNGGGSVTSWYGTDHRGQSALFEVTSLGDGVLTLPGDMVNFRSFNLTNGPEPSTAVLLGLGGSVLWLFRRKQPAV